MLPRVLRPLLWLAMLAAVAAAAQDRPNVVVFLADDAGWGDLGITGNRNLRTPNIDSIATDGVMLESFHVCPVCAPTRAEFLTGRYHPRGGVRGVTRGAERLDTGEKTIADVFRAAGYATGAFGKWHNGSQWPYHPNARGFDQFRGFTSGHWGQYFDPPLEQNGQPVRGKGFITDDLTTHAIRFIEANRGKPFFCYIPYNTPHSPFCVPDEDWARFRNAPLEQRGRQGNAENLATTRCVLAMMENLDRNVGRVLAKLDELQAASNTIVVWFSDNGPNSVRWNDGLKGTKGSTDEGGVRSALLLRWPGRIKPGLRTAELAAAIDLLPTLAALAKVPLGTTKPLDGIDLSPLLLGVTRDRPDRMIFSHHEGRVSVRTRQYRLDSAGALFDMIADPGQTRDLAGERPEAAATLARAVQEWRGEVLGNATADKGKSTGQGTDPRPFPVGYREFPATPLPARDGIPHGAIRRSADAPNCSYFTNWSTKEDFVTWDIDVHSAGIYQVDLHYTCPLADAGSTVEVKFMDRRLAGKMTPGWDPPLVKDEDRIPRKAESWLKEFRVLKLGRIELPQARGPLTLRATSIPGNSVMDLRLVTLTLVK